MEDDKIYEEKSIFLRKREDYKTYSQRRLSWAMGLRRGAPDQVKEIRSGKTMFWVVSGTGDFPSGPRVESLSAGVGTLGSIPGSGRSIKQQATKPMCQLLSLSSTAGKLQLLRLHRSRTCKGTEEKPATTRSLYTPTREWPLFYATRESPRRSNEDPAQAKINK